MVGQRRWQSLRVGIHHVDAQRGEDLAGPAALLQDLRGRRCGVHVGEGRRAARAARPARGPAPTRRTTRWCLSRAGSTGSRLSITEAGSRGVRSTTSARWRPRWLTAPARSAQLASAMTGSRSAIVSCSVAAMSRAPAARTRARTCRSPARKSIRSPARAASAASSRAASIAESSRGTSPMRAAETREVSSTMTTRRSRSGCQVRTTTLRLRALARQSMERTSSPRTYSRSESNSVPAPRIRTADRPSSSRSRASRDGRCLRDSNGGSERTVPGTSRVRLARGQPEGTGRSGRSRRRRGGRRGGAGAGRS